MNWARGWLSAHTSMGRSRAMGRVVASALPMSPLIATATRARGERCMQRYSGRIVCVVATRGAWRPLSRATHVRVLHARARLACAVLWACGSVALAML